MSALATEIAINSAELAALEFAYQQACAFEAAGRPDKAFDQYFMVANSKNTDASTRTVRSNAQYAMARFFEQGLGGASRNLSSMVAWLKKAEENRHPLAPCRLGMCFFLGGEGVKKDLSIAVSWLKKYFSPLLCLEAGDKKEVVFDFDDKETHLALVTLVGLLEQGVGTENGPKEIIILLENVQKMGCKSKEVQTLLAKQQARGGMDANKVFEKLPLLFRQLQLIQSALDSKKISSLIDHLRVNNSALQNNFKYQKARFRNILKTLPEMSHLSGTLEKYSNGSFSMYSGNGEFNICTPWLLRKKLAQTLQREKRKETLSDLTSLGTMVIEGKTLRPEAFLYYPELEVEIQGPVEGNSIYIFCKSLKLSKDGSIKAPQGFFCVAEEKVEIPLSTIHAECLIIASPNVNIQCATPDGMKAAAIYGPWTRQAFSLPPYFVESQNAQDIWVPSAMMLSAMTDRLKTILKKPASSTPMVDTGAAAGTGRADGLPKEAEVKNDAEAEAQDALRIGMSHYTSTDWASHSKNMLIAKGCFQAAFMNGNLKEAFAMLLKIESSEYAVLRGITEKHRCLQTEADKKEYQYQSEAEAIEAHRESKRSWDEYLEWGKIDPKELDFIAATLFGRYEAVQSANGAPIVTAFAVSVADPTRSQQLLENGMKPGWVIGTRAYLAALTVARFQW